VNDEQKPADREILLDSAKILLGNDKLADPSSFLDANWCSMEVRESEWWSGIVCDTFWSSSAMVWSMLASSANIIAVWVEAYKTEVDVLNDVSAKDNPTSLRVCLQLNNHNNNNTQSLIYIPYIPLIFSNIII